MPSSLQPSPYSTQTLLSNSLAVDESANIASLLTFAKTILCQSQNNQATSCYTCNFASLITLQYVLHLPLERGRWWVNRQAISTHLAIPVVLYQHFSRHTSSFPCFLKGCFLLQIESRVYCLTGLKSRWREINLFVHFSIFRRLSNNLSFPLMDSLLFHRNVVRWKAKYPLIFMASMTVFLTERRGNCWKIAYVSN